MKDKKKIIAYLFIISILIVASYLARDMYKKSKIEEVAYNTFVEMIEKGEVEQVKVDLKESKLKFIKGEQTFETDNPKIDNFKEFLLINEVEVVEESGKNKFMSVGFEVLRFGALIGLMIFMVNKMGGGALTKKPKEVAEIPKVTFEDIAGNEESKEDMKFLVEFLKDPSRYIEMGAKFPKGVILYGEPGTGKTLMAKSIAGEAKVPFFSANGADFVEMYVGLGARRVRDLFAEARKNAPCIVFIDEIDALGSTRGGDAANSEKDQTINALLGELSGFSPTDGVLVLAATNRVENLDPALIRPGRFDRHIAIRLPEQRDRVEIIKLHSEDKRLSKNIDIEALAHMTIGFSGAGLETLMNEAAIMAVNKNKKEIDMEDIDDAFYKTIMKGSKRRKDEKRDRDEIEIVAYHEAGHALAAKLLTENAIPKVTITPSTSGAGGVTFNIPKKMGLLTKEEVLNNIKVLYAGRASEYLLRRDERLVTTGASADISQATKEIMRYFNDFGMEEEFGLLNVNEIKKDVTLKSAIELSKELYQDVLTLLEKEFEILRDIANALIEKESLSEEELDAIIEINTRKNSI